MTDIPKTVEEWSKQVSDSGLSGHITMVSDVDGARNIREMDVGEAITNFNTKIPSELIQHLSEILRERDRMVEAARAVSMELPNEELNTHHMASLKHACLLMAIDVIRKKYTGEDHGTTADSDQPSSAEAEGTSTETAS